MDPLSLILFLSGVLLGSIPVLLWARSRHAALRADLQRATAELTLVVNEKAVLAERLRSIAEQHATLSDDIDQARARLLELTSSLAEAQAESRSLREKSQEQQRLLDDLQGRFNEAFENIARRVLVETSHVIDDSHRGTLHDLLSPLKDTIARFEEKVESTHRDTVRENQSLKEQLLQLQQLNKTIGDEAKNLTTALRGQAKTRGNWGEMILERILEQSGLVRGREFLVQEQHVGDDGRRLQPDVIILMPEGRQVVVDSKVSLVAYERYCAAEGPEARAQALAEHVESVRRHVRELAEKRYERLEALQSPEFVLMFVPIEPAFNDAVNADAGLCSDALTRNVVLVSTSSLLATLRIIASLWRVERQNRNAIEIARRAGDLYDKFVGFLDDMEELGRKIESTRNCHEIAVAKLKNGRGNLVRRVEELKQLGARASKSIDPAMLEQPEPDENLDAS